jgi:hypothetical protein
MLNAKARAGTADADAGIIVDEAPAGGALQQLRAFLARQGFGAHPRGQLSISGANGIEMHVSIPQLAEVELAGKHLTRLKAMARQTIKKLEKNP